jgi:hypothetical protein
MVKYSLTKPRLLNIERKSTHVTHNSLEDLKNHTSRRGLGENLTDGETIPRIQPCP